MKGITLITKGKKTCEALYKQLSDLIGDRVHINSYYLDGNIKSNITDDLIVISSREVYDDARKYINSECRFIIARRSIDYNEIKKLLNIKPGTDVLLANDLKSSTFETIGLLKELGFNYINYFPYYPGIENEIRLKTAIIPGEMEIVPEYVENVIDINIRGIDFTTMVEILSHLNLLNQKANIVSARYVRNIIALLKEIKQISDVNNEINNQLQTILNTVHDGIIAANSDDIVTVYNPVAEEITGMSKDETLDKRLNDKLSELLKQGNSEEKLVKINGRKIVINNYSICEGDASLGRLYTLKDVTKIQRLELELRRKLRSEENCARYTFDDIVGTSQVTQASKVLANKVAKSNSPILILGENGTGKELFAQAIHNASDRVNGPFIAVNFAALPESLLESELFGFEEGAFTGAKKGGMPGLFEQAHGGTIFLDEIGDAPLSFQVRLLRVLQEKQIRRVGGNKIIPIDVRVISATNRDLRELVESGAFRQDLYYRLNVLLLKVPSLRERKEDIMNLAKAFYYECLMDDIAVINAENYFKYIQEYLISYDWPGNIRELHNVVEYLVSVSRNVVPSMDILTDELKNSICQPVKGEDFEKRVLLEIHALSSSNLPTGRRSLSKKLNISESRVRDIIDLIHNKGFIEIHRGVKGIRLTKQGKIEIQAYLK